MSCQRNDADKMEQTPVNGDLNIFCDPAFYPLVLTIKDAFCSQYPGIAVNVVSGYENQKGKLLLNNSYSVIVTSCKLSTEDSTILASQNIFINQFHMATDGIALVSSISENSGSDTDTCLTENFGKATNKLRIVTLPGNSDDIKYFSYIYNEADINNWIGLQQVDSIIEYVSRNSSAIGLIPMSYLCENKNPAVIQRKSKIKIQCVKSVMPNQSTLSTYEYPFTRPVYLIAHEPFAGPAHGFASYIASDEGQRVIRMFGLVPSKVPPREIQIINR
ncbi:MAG: substrate-binding domain-containing protein [Bacteroidetes bacterium]|nr:substrate-binding domain-containing protein [Bacteroidota bacterium]